MGSCITALLTWLRNSSPKPLMSTMMLSHSKACRHPARSAASNVIINILSLIRRPSSPVILSAYSRMVCLWFWVSRRKMLHASSKGVPVIQSFSNLSRKSAKDVNTRPPGPSSSISPLNQDDTLVESCLSGIESDTSYHQMSPHLLSHLPVPMLFLVK